MRIRRFIPIAIIAALSAITLYSCTQEKDNNQITPDTGNTGDDITTPATYEFNRLGNSSVNYSGQTSRLDQLAELTIELKKGDAGNVVSSTTLLNMFANTNNPFSQVYPKDLKSKTFSLDVSYFENLLTEAGNLSGTTITASSGIAGILSRSNGSTILVDSGGREFTQLIEKGLMGATFYNQIVNNYLSASKIGPSVDNDAIDTANNNYYTDMEHHFDEAFGYMGFPKDFSSNYAGSETVRFWGKYSNSADDDIQLNDKLMNAFKKGRAAIVAKNYTVLDEQVAILHAQLEIMIAATVIHYINSTITEPQIGERHHSLSEAYAFLRALRYSNFDERKISASDINDMLEVRIGGNFYNTTSLNLKYIKTTLSSTYGLDSVKDLL